MGLGQGPGDRLIMPKAAGRKEARIEETDEEG